MQRFRDIHAGKRIWLLGCGVSLLDINTHQIPEDDIIICCNSSVLYAHRFDYACFTDGLMKYWKYYTNLKDHPCKVIIFNQAEIPAVKEETYFIAKRWPGTKMSKEDTEVIFGQDVVHCALHFAYMLGGREIILCGCDCFVEKPHYHWNDKAGIKLDYHDNMPMDLHDNGVSVDYGFDAELQYWKDIYRHNRDLKIINCSAISAIPHYPRKKFNDIINGI